MQPMAEFTVGGLKLRAPATWSFTETTGLVVGRSTRNLGALQIHTASRRAVPRDAALIDCQMQLTKWLGAPRPVQVARHADGFGVVELTGADGVGRAWWHLRPEGLLLASYRTRLHAWTPVAKADRDEADSIVLTARWFD